MAGSNPYRDSIERFYAHNHKTPDGLIQKQIRKERRKRGKSAYGMFVTPRKSGSPSPRGSVTYDPSRRFE